MLNAQDYPFFSQSELTDIARTNPIAKNRIIDYQRTLKNLQKSPKKIQLIRINTYLNQFLPQYDDVINKKKDFWATPKEFLKVGFGDCEDYAIIKYFSLIKLGFAKEKLYLTIVKNRYTKNIHMVLSYFSHQTAPPLILDNLSFRVLPLQKREDLRAVFFINDTGVFTMHHKKLLKVAATYPKYKQLKKRVSKEVQESLPLHHADLLPDK
jgi:predicted transglutaminase-like cysteine proteinase